MWPIFLSNCCEFQSHAASGLDMAHHGLGSDLPFVHEKINLCCSANGRRLAGLNKHSSEAEVSSTQNVILST